MLQHKKHMLVVGLTALAILNFAIADTYAYWRASGISENTLTTGELQGSIVEVCNPSEAEGLYPGDTVNKVVHVANTGTLDMVVRVKVEKSWVNASATLDEDMILINFDSTMWYDAEDGYYYYKGVLAPNETTQTPLMESFTLSSSASNEYAGQQAEITVSMEALQATADAISEEWGIDYTALGIQLADAQSTQSITVEFTSDKEFVFGNDGDLFAAFANLMPGETRIQEIELVNSFGETVEFFLFSEELTGSTELLEFLTNYVTITVLDEDGTRIYSGSVTSSDLQQELSLGAYAAGASRTLQIQLEVDAAAGNTYQSLSAENIQWTFVAQEEDEDTEQNGAGDGAGAGAGATSETTPSTSTSMPSTSTTTSTTASSSSSLPQTGDNSWIIIALCTFIGLVAAVMAIRAGLSIRREVKQAAELQADHVRDR